MEYSFFSDMSDRARARASVLGLVVFFLAAGGFGIVVAATPHLLWTTLLLHMMCWSFSSW